MNKTRLASLLTAFAACGFMTACDFGSNDDSSKPEISGFDAPSFAESQDAWAEGTPVSFKGTVSDDNSVKEIKFQIVDKTTGNVIKELQTFTIDKSSVTFGPDQDLKVSFTNTGSWVNTGSYWIRIVAIDNDGLTSSEDLNFTSIVGTATPDVYTAVDTLGANDNTKYGSYFDVRSLESHTQAEANTMKDEIDLFFGFATAGAFANKLVLFSTAEAKAGSFDNVKDWAAGDVRATEIRKTTLTEAQFNALNTTSALQSAFTSATPSTPAGRTDVTANTAYAVKTTDATPVYAVIWVGTVSGTGATASIAIKGAVEN